MTLLDVARSDDGHTVRRLSAEPVIWLGTVHPDGRPHNVPVWFAWQDPMVLIFSRPKTVKVGNMRRAPAVSLDSADGGLSRESVSGSGFSAITVLPRRRTAVRTCSTSGRDGVGRRVPMSSSRSWPIEAASWCQTISEASSAIQHHAQRQPFGQLIGHTPADVPDHRPHAAAQGLDSSPEDGELSRPATHCGDRPNTFSR